MAQQTLNKLITLIEKAIADFQKKIPGLQSGIFDELQAQLQLLKTSNGKILSNVENLKRIGIIKNRLQKIILNDDYINEIKKFIAAFDAVSSLQLNYFSSFNDKYTPSKTLEMVKQLSIEATVNSLTEAGIGANIIDPIISVLRANITTGGSIADLNNLLRNQITTNETGDGTLERYSKQITTDAINQYSAQYNQTIASDLGLEWFMYVGSNITTTRPFCEALTKKKYVHVSELPMIVKGWIDGHRVHINKKTGLPDGMIPGTNEKNITIYRGGFNCGHQLIAVDEAAVPADVKAKIAV